LSEALGADVEVVARGMGLDSRIGPKFLHPGPGFGGSCFPKDARAAVQIAHEHGLRFQIMEAVLAVNCATQVRMVDKIEAAFEGLEDKVVGVLGLAFKPETDDIRESPALAIVDGLLERGARVQAFDPAAMDACRPRWPDVTFCETSYEVADGAHGLVILTEWNQFRALEMTQLRKRLARPLIVDLRNIYEPSKLAAAGFHYVSVGRPEGRPRSES
jgi:UDPglucose 6-dehydrogenase